MQRRTFCTGLLSAAVFAMPNQAINANTHSYAQAQLVSSPARWLFISGQVPADANGKVPKTFEEQCRLAWRNVQAQLEAADMNREEWLLEIEAIAAA